MDNALIAQKICSGILAGNEKLARWTAGDWVCDRQNTECFLVDGVGEALRAALPSWPIWPETTAGENFEWLGTSYTSRVNDCPPESVFGGLRYDIGLLRSRRLLSGLVEIKKAWDDVGLDDRHRARATRHDLVKLADVLFYLGTKPHVFTDQPATGVAIESVFFGTFLWHEPQNRDFTAQNLSAQFDQIKIRVNRWWMEATTGGGRPIQGYFRKEYGVCPQPEFAFEVRRGTANGTKLAASAVCVWLSLDATP